ncbi:MAG: S1 family peptidase [Rhodanobacter sp.]
MHVLPSMLRKATSRMTAFGCLVLLMLAGLYGAAAQAVSLDPAVLPKIQAATFEVVAAKPVNDPLTYEKPLPLELLPYQERTDKYYSIGTAFALGNNRYVTAAHVLQIGIGSLWGAPALRDASGHVYAIDKIEKYSLQQDFVVFSLAEQPANAAALQVNTKPALNEVVYAVGNALGTGVVIRDGLYTSDTPEDQDGRWKWMRFSAAASPGNSGGPLLDKDGKLIGIVLMKSANENLNYALPIGIVLDAPDHLAVMDERMPYQLDIFDTVANGTFKGKFTLPRSFADFSATFSKLFDAYIDAQLKVLLAKDADKLFPRGAGSNRLLHGLPRSSSFPALIVRNSTGDWVLSGRPGQKIPLSANGYVEPGLVGHNLMFHLRKPDDLPADQLYGNPAVLMEQLAKIGFLQRAVGTEKVKITALGQPSSDTSHIDAWQRRWQVRVWPLPYLNVRLVTFSLPVPDGYVTMLRFAPPGHEYDSVVDLKVLTDFVDVGYDGSLAQWKDYLKRTELLPAVFKNIRIETDDDQRFNYASKRMKFNFTPALQKIAPASELTLGFSYFTDHDKVVWDVGEVRVRVDAGSEDLINIRRNVAPSDDLDDDYKSRWRKISQRQHPYDDVALSDNDTMKITAVVNPSAGAAPSVLYTAFYGVEGSQPQDAMKAKLNLLMKNLQVTEH